MADINMNTHTNEPKTANKGMPADFKVTLLSAAHTPSTLVCSARLTKKPSKSRKRCSVLLTLSKEDPQYCMDFDEWAARLDFEDRRRIMNFLWNDSVWHDTCLREEDALWEDKSKSEPADPQPPLCGDDDDLPF